MIIIHKNNNRYYYIKIQLIERIIKVFENANNLEKEKVRLYWRYDISVEIIRCVYYVIKFFLISDRSNISPINKTYESKLHQINSNISYIFTISCRAARERDERALDTSLQIFRSESHVPPIYRPYIPLCADIVSQTVTYDPSLSKSVNGLIFNRPRPRSSNFSLSLFLSLRRGRSGLGRWEERIGRYRHLMPRLEIN